MANDTTVSQGLGSGLNYENIDTSKTLTAADSGVIQNVIADGQVITLPATAANLVVYVRNGGVPKTGAPAGTGDDASVLVSIAPNASDGVSGLAFTAATNKAINNTKATAKVGDFIKLIGSGTSGVTAWQVLEARGVWARAA